MVGKKEAVLALLGQPNSGKSTLFNRLTGSNQHVGNWAGKTVEKKEGSFCRDGITWKVMDLPGSYSLMADSEEEIVTRDYIKEGAADVVCLMADASQLTRSMYMVAEFAGIGIPAILLLNMMDVAVNQGKRIDVKKIEERLAVPVLPFVAADKRGYEAFYLALSKAFCTRQTICTRALFEQYKKHLGNDYVRLLGRLPEQKSTGPGNMWIAVKCLEQDGLILREYGKYLPLDVRMEKKSIQAADAKYDWINQILEDVVEWKRKESVMGTFDRLAVAKRWGRWIALGVIILALFFSMLIARPVTMLAEQIPGWLQPLLTGFLEDIHTAPFLVALAGTLVPNILSLALTMSGYMLGITFVFSLIEEVGYMARISFVFDGLMAKLGLQGKSVMAFFMGAGCTVGGTMGCRVIDNWGQRVLAMALVWAVPCGATWSVMPSLATMFFGPVRAMAVMAAILIVMIAFMGITAYTFRRFLAPKEKRVGMIMEMPPYHRPRWGFLVQHTLMRAKDIFFRALSVIFLVSLAFWCLTYSRDGNVTGSFIYKVGIRIEPITRIFGLGWQTFLAFVASVCSKEAALGVLGSLYVNKNALFDSSMQGAVLADLGGILPGAIAKPEALAFIFATTFNMPCVMALAATYRESHSLKWTVCIALFYTGMALLLSCLVYRVGVYLF